MIKHFDSLCLEDFWSYGFPVCLQNELHVGLHRRPSSLPYCDLEGSEEKMTCMYSEFGSISSHYEQCLKLLDFWPFQNVGLLAG